MRIARPPDSNDHAPARLWTPCTKTTVGTFQEVTYDTLDRSSHCRYGRRSARPTPTRRIERIGAGTRRSEHHSGRRRVLHRRHGHGEPSFGNYDLGGAVAVNFNRYVGVEGEVSGALGVSQSLTFDGVTADRKTPHLLNYSGNVVVSAPNQSSVVPYVTGGVGGLSLFEPGQPRHRRDRDVPDRQRRRRRQVVRRPLGAARRLPLHRRAVEGRCAGVLRPGHALRPPRVRGRAREHRR